MQGERDCKAEGRLFASAVGEWLLIAAVFAAAGAWPVPDVNEAHYLPKARHAFDPSWCEGDFFLESPHIFTVVYPDSLAAFHITLFPPQGLRPSIQL